MKKKIFTLLGILWIATVIHSQELTFEWAFGCGSSGITKSFSMAIDELENVYITGRFTDTVDFDPGMTNFSLIGTNYGSPFIASYDKHKNLRWAFTYENGDHHYATSIATDNEGFIYTTGGFTDTVDFDPGPGMFQLYPHSIGVLDIYICKFDSTGSFIWAKNIGDIYSEYGTTIKTDQFNNIYLTGVMTGIVDFDPGPGISNVTGYGNYDVFVAKYSSSGELNWAKAFGGAGEDYGDGIAVDLNGNVYVTGRFYEFADFDPGIGTNLIYSNGLDDIFICKFDAVGNIGWVRTIGGTEGDSGKDISVDPSGNVYTTGVFSNNVDFDPGPPWCYYSSYGGPDVFICKHDPTGKFEWAKRVGGYTLDASNSIFVDPNGFVFTTGLFKGSFNTGQGNGIPILNSSIYDAFVAVFDFDGSFIWADHFGHIPPGGSCGISICRGPDTSFYLLGDYYNSIDFNLSDTFPPLTSVGTQNIFLAKFSVCNNSYSEIIELVCGNYISPSGNYIWYTSGIYKDTLTNAAGNDSIITLYLTIIDVNVSVTQQDNNLTANAIGVIYQWIDCQNGNTPIPGATNQSTTPTQNGSYAVIITQNGCTDTSSCYTISTIGMEGAEEFSGIKIYPNPANDILYIDLGNSLGSGKIELINTSGQVLMVKEIGNQTKLEFDLRHLPAGEYFIRLIVEEKQVYVEKIVKE
ncbi:MAG: SBBP repeat-containing protein [Bacteroidales bacterium]|nr:SBBP repeat-containing protein [Bacteroidales bacterium]MCF8456871.1 SBBP repeat-containing protein [Bacteroidales bacterium]